MTNSKNFPTLGPIIIGTSDLKKAKEFYIAVFGLTIQAESSNYVSAHGIDGTHIELEEYSENRFPNWKKHNVGTYKNCQFYVTNIHSFLDSVQKHGGKIVSKPITKPWGSCAEFADTDGNIFLIGEK